MWNGEWMGGIPITKSNLTNSWDTSHITKTSFVFYIYVYGNVKQYLSYILLLLAFRTRKDNKF